MARAVIRSKIFAALLIQDLHINVEGLMSMHEEVFRYIANHTKSLFVYNFRSFVKWLAKSTELNAIQNFM